MYFFLIVNHLATKLGQLIEIVKGNIFRKYFPRFGGLCPKSRLFLIYQCHEISQKPNMSLWFYTLLKNCTKIIRSYSIAYLSKSQKGQLEIVFNSSQQSQKQVGIVCHELHKYQIKLLILPRLILENKCMRAAQTKKGKTTTPP